MIFCNERKKYMKRVMRKSGASLPMVVIIGVALVIWVLALLPLMTTSGTQAVKTARMEQEYLDSRSAIEFAKSELLQIVDIESKPPYTFAVVDKSIGDPTKDTYEFEAIPKRDAAGVTEEYDAVIDTNETGGTDLDDDDTPGENGDKVVAICSVVSDSEGYFIEIKTYNKGKEGISYSTHYTMGGNLLIYPESYRQTQALPLSDFVVVDGKMGSNDVWLSNINNNADGSGVTYENYLAGADGEANRNFVSSFTEYMRPWIVNADAAYANTGRFPAVFKTTAHTSVTEPAVVRDMLGDLEAPEQWTKLDSSMIYFDAGSGTVKWHGTNATLSGATIYYNGDPATPSVPGRYQIIMDYAGDPDNYILPVTGLCLNVRHGSAEELLPYYEINSSIFNDTHTMGQCTIKEVQGNQVKLETKDATGTPVFGYTDDPNGTGIVWTTSNPLTLPADGTTNYYIYYYIQEKAKEIRSGWNSVLSGVNYVKQSDIQYVGTVYYYGRNIDDIKVPISEMEDGKEYLIIADSEAGTLLYKNDSGNLAAGGSVPSGYHINKFTSSQIWIDTAEGSNSVTLHNKAGGDIAFEKGNYTSSSISPEVREDISDTSRKFQHNVAYNNCTFSKLSESGTLFEVKNQGLLFTANVPTLGWQYQTRDRYWFFGYHYGSWYDSSFEIDNGSDSIKGKEVYFSTSPNNFISTSSKTICLIKKAETQTGSIPSEADANRPKSTQTYDFSKSVSVTANYKISNLITDLTEYYGDRIDTKTLYVNSVWKGHSSHSNDVLGIGTYMLTAQVTETTVDGNTYTFVRDIGTVTITRKSISLPALTDAHVTVRGNTAEFTYSRWADEVEGMTRYYGYRDADGEHWFEFTGTTEVINGLPTDKGEITFMVAQSDNLKKVTNPSIRELSPKVITGEIYLSNGKRKGETSDKTKFSFAFNADGDPHWYRLPLGIGGPNSEITLAYGVKNAEGDIEWKEKSQVSGAVVEKYGVWVENSNYPRSGGLAFEIGAPLNIIAANGGYYASYLKAQSMYFMGDYNPVEGDTAEVIDARQTSLNTHGVSVILETDLLVLNNEIKGGGSVYVYSYNGSEDFLLFVLEDYYVGGTKVFREKCFYQIPSGTDLLSVTDPNVAEAWVCKDQEGSNCANGTFVDRDDAGKVIAVEIPETVEMLFKQGRYPSVDLNIAYATNEQLAHIISGETIEWTTDGVWKYYDNDFNEMYAVCVYVNRIDSEVSYRANRILIATASEDGINVPYNVTLHTRYFSIDATRLVQGLPGIKFELHNIVNAEYAENFFGDIAYNSGTLQVDYERNTEIVTVDAAGTRNSAIMEKKICRYESGTDLFAGATSQELMVTYTTDNINTQVDTVDAFNVLKNIELVDRYITITAEGASSTKLLFDNNSYYARGRDFKIYSNYIVFDESVTGIEIRERKDAYDLVDGSGLFPYSNSLTVNSQESGYTNKEYLGFFKDVTAENYNGTLIYVAREEGLLVEKYVTKVTAVREGFLDYEYFEEPSEAETVSFTLPKGFYFVKSESTEEDLNADGLFGTSILNVSLGAHGVTKQQLEDIALTVNPETGKIEGPYVDTDLMYGTGEEGGFGGGTVK